MVRSKLPHVGTTIFTVMTNRARELNAINLAQGFPDYDAPAKLKDLVAYHVWFAPTRTLPPSFKVRVVKGLPGVPDDPAYFLPRRFSEVETVPVSGIDGQHIWVAYRARRWDENRPPMSHVKTLGYQTRNVLASVAQGEQVFLVELSRER